MSNHNQWVLCVNEKQESEWSTQAVLERWHKLFKGTIVIQRWSLAWLMLI